MKKIAVLLALVLILLNTAAVTRVCAGFSTTAPAQSTAAETKDGYEDGMVRGKDITAPITVCVFAVCACTVYGIVKIRKHKNDIL